MSNWVVKRSEAIWPLTRVEASIVAVESYELDVVDYLLKPITFSRFFKSVNKFLAKWEAPSGELPTLVVPPLTETFLFVSSQRKQVKIPLSDGFFGEFGVAQGPLFLYPAFQFLHVEKKNQLFLRVTPALAVS